MHQPNLLKILDKLPLQEVKQFQKYLKKRFPNSKTSIQVLEQLVKVHPLYHSDNFDREALYQKVFNKKYDTKRWSKELATLENYLQEYLMIHFLEKEKLEKDFLALKIYKKHKVEELFFRQIKETKKLVEQSKLDTWFWFKKMYLEEEHYFSPLSENTQNPTASVEAAMENLDIFYAVSKLKYACELLNRHHTLQSPFPDIQLFEEILKMPQVNSNIHFALYHKIFLLLGSKSPELYHSTKSFVFANLSEVSQSDQYTLLGYLHNSISKCFGSRPLELAEEAFQLYEFGIEQEIFILDGYFDKEYFNNIVDLACKLKKFEWAQNFIDQSQEKLEISIRNDTILIAKAIVQFEKGDFSQTINLIKDLKFVNVFYKIRANLLLICSYYENKESAELITLCSLAFEKTIQRNKIIHPSTQDKALNFIRIVKQLVGNINPNKEKLLDKLNQYDHLFFRKWLIEKIEQLK